MPDRLIEGRNVAWREAGEGPPAILLHCALAHSGAFAGIMNRLADRLSMRAIDLPGHGGTELDASRDLQEQSTGDVLAMLAESSEPAHLIGHSFGGTVALRAALEAPDKVASLILFEPVYFSFLSPEERAAFSSEAEAQEALYSAAAAGDWEAAAENFLGRWGAPGRNAMTRAQASYVRDRMPLVIESEASIRSGPGIAVRPPDLDRISCPVLLMAGADTQPVAHAILDIMARGIPHSRRVVLPDIGHMAPILAPDAVAGEIRRFLDSL